MHRNALIALSILACALVSGGGEAAPAYVAEVPAHRPASVEVFGADEVASVLRIVNPALGEPQVQRIAAAVVRYSAKYGLEPDLVTAVLKTESNARPWARSPKGAVGLMQVMPHMFAHLGLPGNLATIETNVEAGCLILADNIRRLGEDDGISAYFWGSDIRGARYLNAVRAERAEVRRLARS